MRYSVGYNLKEDRFEVHRFGCKETPEDATAITAVDVHDAIAEEVESYNKQGQDFTADDFHIHPCVRE